MAELSHDEVVGVLGRLSDVMIIAEIIATGITRDELAAARERAGAQSPTQREATMIRQFEIRWSDLGCPTAPDLYDYKGKPVLVTRSNIQDAQNNPDAICTVICATPVSGPETCAVGEIKLPD